MRTKSRGHDWGVVLAAGEGSRLAPLTRALYGQDLPKQFATLGGSRSLIEGTVARVARIVPARRIVVVVASRYVALARHQLVAYPEVDVVAQPQNLGTGPGVLLPLARIRARDAQARVAIFPSDHHYRQPRPVLDGVRSALAALEVCDCTAVLLGVEARRPETEYGWIETGPSYPGLGLRQIARFVEKPSPDLAACLLASGALWNTLITVARVADLWALLARLLPEQTAAFALYSRHLDAAGAGRLLDVLYEDMTPANVSHDVFARASGLAVKTILGAGFSDWGTPERVLESLEGTRFHRRLVERMGRVAAPRPVPQGS